MAAVDGDAGAADPAGAWRRKERNDVPHLLGTAEPTEWELAIDERRLARVAAAAEVLMPRYAGPGDDIRVDVILLAPGTRPRHIENAWIG